MAGFNPVRVLVSYVVNVIIVYSVVPLVKPWFHVKI